MQAASKHKVFISYHHKNDQLYKDRLSNLNKLHNIFKDQSVNTGNIDENLSDETIRRVIRDDYLRDTTVTILLVGTETAKRKHIDWEVYSSMFDGAVNKKSGILIINLPSTKSEMSTAAHGEKEKKILHPEYTNWMSIDKLKDYKDRYPYISDRILENLVKSDVQISVIPWSKVNSSNLRLLIDLTFNNRSKCNYDLSRPMMK
ncbi:TIR domain-containing protein [Candidatus Woesearchaeota archaeon]|nr:TIR domain-containing protein [Candidatus Woesearchaeota archaeon]